MMKSVIFIHLALVGLGLVLGAFAENKDPAVGAQPLEFLAAFPLGAALMVFVLGSASLATGHAWVGYAFLKM